MLIENHPFYNLCYVLTELFYHQWGKEKGFHPYRATVNGASHWWLQNDEGEICDPSSGQFSQPYPYHRGKPAGFLTKQPSKRCNELKLVLDKVRYKK